MLRPISRVRRWTRAYATVSPYVPQNRQETPLIVSSELDELLLNSLSASQTGLRDLIHQYSETSGRILGSSLPYESRPTGKRRCTFGNGDSVVLIAHCLRARDGRNKITVSSGFALSASASNDEEPLILSCAHTLEEIRRSPLLTEDGVSSGSFLVTGTTGSLSLKPLSKIVSALPRSDVLLLRGAGKARLSTLPVSPYPAPPGTPVRAHFIAQTNPLEEGWTPWVGGTWSKWVRGSILAYRDFAGRETEPGTYDSLAQMFFSPLPTPGSSGGPVVDEESGAVVGVVLGTQMANRVEGVRGWGVPSETIFEMFSLPTTK